MDWSQWLFAAILSAALAAGKPPLGLTAVMIGNFVLTVILSGNPEFVATVDLASFALLIGGNGREVAVAAIFVGTASFGLIAYRLQAPHALIYTAIDAMAYVQCGVIGGADRGMGRFLRAARRYSFGGACLDNVAGRVVVARDLAGNSQKDRG